MNSLLVRFRTASRPLALASGRVASGRTSAVVAAIAAVTLLTACGVGSEVSGPGGGIGGGGGGGGGGTDTVPVFAQLSAGDTHTCALTEQGVAWCWGLNGDGRLGTGDTARRVSPRPVQSGSTSFRQVSAGGAHTCALDANGVAYCWGSNASGQLGAGSTVVAATAPTRVLGSRSWLSISAGASHTCAIAQNGTAFCWGSNASGELGTGSAAPAFEPVQVSSATGLAGALAISAGDRFTCALRGTGAAMCWGRAGRLGGAAGQSAVPVDAQSQATYGGLDAGGEVACAIEPAVQRAACWGDPTRVGSASATGTAPTRVQLDVDLASVSAGGTSACALTVTGLARCWGANGGGQLGDGSSAGESRVPVPVAGDRAYRSISVGGTHACAITTLLQTFCWGRNDAGQLGLGNASATPVRTPSRVS